MAYCRRRADPSDVDDLTAEVFLVAWNKIEQIPTGDAALLWLYGVAFRVVNRRWRTSARGGRAMERLKMVVDVASVSTPDAVVVQGEEYRTALRAAARLALADQEILRLTLWEELSHVDAAEVLGIEVGAVRQRAHRARRRLGDEYRRLTGERPVPPARKGKEVSE